MLTYCNWEKTCEATLDCGCRPSSSSTKSFSRPDTVTSELQNAGDKTKKICTVFSRLYVDLSWHKMTEKKRRAAYNWIIPFLKPLQNIRSSKKGWTYTQENTALGQCLPMKSPPKSPSRFRHALHDLHATLNYSLGRPQRKLLQLFVGDFISEHYRAQNMHLHISIVCSLLS